jgi:uncharacterized RDD family membrane protein YckC
VLDALIQGAALFALLVLVGFAIPGSAGIVVAIVGVALVVLGYPVLCETLMRGRSPGKAALGLRVVTTEGAPVAFRHAFIRSTLGIVDFLLPPGGLFAVITSLLSPRGQRLGDLVAGTIVLRERTALTPSGAVWFNPPAGLIGYAQSLDVSVVTDAQFAVVRGFLLRVQDLVPEARFSMALRLSTPIAAAMHHTIPNGMHPEQFLVCVAAAHQRRGGLPAPEPMQAPAVPPPPPPPGPPPPPPPPAFRPAPPSETGTASPAGAPASTARSEPLVAGPAPSAPGATDASDAG